MIVPGTCGACRHYLDGECRRPGSAFAGRPLWALACVPCQGYERSATPASPVPAEALGAVSRNR